MNQNGNLETDRRSGGRNGYRPAIDLTRSA